MTDQATATTPVPASATAAPATTEAPSVASSEAPASAPQATPSTQEAKAPEETSPPPHEDPKLAARFAALARKEKAIRERESKLASDAKAYKEWQETQALAKSNPIEFLQRSGLSYDEITNYLMNEGLPPSIDKKVESIEEKIRKYEEAQVAARQEAQRQQIDAQLNAFKKTIHEHIDTHADRYELIKAEGVQDEVYQLIEQHFAHTKEVMPIEKAAQAVEDFLFEEAKKLAKVNKLKSLIAPETSVKDTKEKPVGDNVAGATGTKDTTPDRTTVPVMTLTNSATSAAVPRTVQSQRLSREEALKQATEMLRFT